MSLKRSTTPAVAKPRPITAQPAPATALARSAVYRKLPLAIRPDVDQAILMRPKGLPTLESISAHFDLPKYGLTLPALRAYARRLENLVRPAAAGQIMAIVFGSLPPSFRRRIRNGTEVLLLSRMAQSLAAEGPHGLSVAELARLGPVLATMSRHHRQRESACAKRTRATPPKTGQVELQPAAVKGLVHGLYGLRIDLSGAGLSERRKPAPRLPSELPEPGPADGQPSTPPAKK